MRIALGLPSRIVGASGELMLEWATRADRGPFSSLVVTDRVVSRALEPLAVLAIAGGATRRIRLMTSVVIGPTRETTLLARQTATIDRSPADGSAWVWESGCARMTIRRPGSSFTGAAAEWMNSCQSCAACGQAKRYRRNWAPLARHRRVQAVGRNCSLVVMCRR